MQNPEQFKIPTWFLNRQRDITTGKSGHLLSNVIDQKMRDDLERLKKIRSHRGLRHHWGLKVRGQHTCTTYVLSLASWCWIESDANPPSLVADEERPSPPRRSKRRASCMCRLSRCCDARLSPSLGTYLVHHGWYQAGRVQRRRKHCSEGVWGCLADRESPWRFKLKRPRYRLTRLCVSPCLSLTIQSNSSSTTDYEPRCIH